MIRLSDEQARDFQSAVADAVGRADVHRAVHNLYDQLQQAIDQRRPLCAASGRCCRFDQFGHRLFVTTMELATFLHELRTAPANADTGGCPFQVDKLCSVHTIRPFGCRVFFCDPTATEWQQDQYANFHSELRRLHDELCIAYFYVEWRRALGIIGEINGARD